jgi:hypothetical protein
MLTDKAARKLSGFRRVLTYVGVIAAGLVEILILLGVVLEWDSFDVFQKVVLALLFLVLWKHK